MMRLVIILFFALLLQGCGHKVPLTLPASGAQSSLQSNR
ncbi:MAG: lipoprotein [Pseudomonadota bacterium]